MSVSVHVMPVNDCPYCHGVGEVLDPVPYGMGSALLPSLCSCVEYRAYDLAPQDVDVESVEIVIVSDPENEGIVYDSETGSA